MKRIYSCLMAAIAIVGGINFADAEVLTPAQALSRIESSQPMKRAKNRKGGEFRLAFIIEKENFPCVYIFENNGTNFVVSADDSVVGLLGYFDGNGQEMTPALQQWLDNYAAEITAIRHAGVRADVEEAIPDTREDIAPMLTTQWNQNAPYNDLCPTNGKSRYLTGSEAVAMAQVMNYHKWPQKEGVAAFDWDNMLDLYTDAATSAQKNAVASLMFAATESVDMKYGDVGIPDDTKIASALIENFNYDKGITLLLRKFYSANQWDAVIYEQLQKYGPVIMKSVRNYRVQAFVCDGYKNGGFFHINWGWGGFSDGYFLLSLLKTKMPILDNDSFINPNDPTSDLESFTTSFNNDIRAIVNITKPQSDSSYRTNILSDERFVIADSKNTGEFAHEVVMSPYTMMPIGITGIPTILLVSDDKTIAAAGQEITLEPGKKSQYYKVALPDNIPDGNYEVLPVFVYNGEYLPIQTPFGAVKTATASVNDGALTFTNTDYSGIVFMNLTVNSTSRGHGLDIKGDLVNRTYEGSFINIVADIYDANLKEIMATTKSERNYVESYSSITIYFNFDFILPDGEEKLPEGSYYAVLKDADKDFNLSDPIPFLVEYYDWSEVESVATDRQEIVRMYNLSGLEVDKTTQSPGIYIVEIRNGDGTFTRRLIKK